MQKNASQVSSGNIAPTVIGPQKDLKEVFVLSGLVLFLSGLIAAAWYYGKAGEQVKIASATEKVDNANVSEILRKAGTVNQAEAAPAGSMPVTAPVVTPADIIHADVYFESGGKGLSIEGKALLAAQAGLLKQDEEYGVLIQGYTDRQGPAGYNKQLGLKRAEAVKMELVKAGVAEHRIAAVSLGEEGVLCIDTNDLCRRMNRRAHLEISRIGREHMAAPVAAPTTAVDLSESGFGSATTTEDASSPVENHTKSTGVGAHTQDLSSSVR